MYLVFDTQAQAQIALTQIWDNMKPPTIGTTTCWAVERQRLDGKWIFEKPDSEYMTGVVDYTEEEYSTDWFESAGLEV